jgi:hypothetical protein
MDTLVATLIAWIAAHSNLTVADRPHIEIVPRQTMSNLYFGAASTKNFYHLQAFYLPAKATVYLPESWRRASLRDKSILVHELVHHLQAANNVRVSCPAALEREAYNLQFKWLREQSVKDPYEYSGLNVLTVTLASTCPE